MNNGLENDNLAVIIYPDLLTIFLCIAQVYNKLVIECLIIIYFLHKGMQLVLISTLIQQMIQHPHVKVDLKLSLINYGDMN